MQCEGAEKRAVQSVKSSGRSPTRTGSLRLHLTHVQDLTRRPNGGSAACLFLDVTAAPSRQARHSCRWTQLSQRKHSWAMWSLQNSKSRKRRPNRSKLFRNLLLLYLFASRYRSSAFSFADIVFHLLNWAYRSNPFLFFHAGAEHAVIWVQEHP